MTITIKFIHNSDNGFTKMYKNISRWELKKLNQNYMYKIVQIPLNEMQNYSFLRSMIIVFDNIPFSQYLSLMIKKIKYSCPLASFIFISKNVSCTKKIELLNCGIDHFLEDDISCEKLLKAIIKNIVNRLFYIDSYNSVFLHANDYCLDIVDNKVWKNENLMSITRREFDLFKYFIINKNKIISKTEILENVWGYVGIPDTTNIVSQHVFRIRKKLKLHNLINRQREGYIYIED